MSEDAGETSAAPSLVYRIELGFPPGAAPHWKALGSVAGARKRPQTERILWHDTPGGELARHHLALAEQNGTWSLTALRPGKHPWPPASLPPSLAEAIDRDALGLSLQQNPAPIASFTGERRTLEITRGDHTVTAVWTEGRVRGVIDEQPIARITLAGALEALEQMALALADQGAFVPLASLAAQAIATAEHASPAPRHKGAAHVPEGCNAGDGLALAIGQLVDAMLHWAAAIPAATTSEPVHQMRVAVRRLRSLLGAPQKAATGSLWHGTRTMLRALACELGEAREWDVFLEGIGAQMERQWPADPRISALLSKARKRREAVYETLRTDLTAASMRRLTVGLALFATLRPFMLEGDPDFWAMDCREFAASALDRRVKKLFAPAEDLTLLPPAELHEVRKNAKRLRYACELFGSFWGGKSARKYLDRLSELQAALGEINDAASLEPLLQGLGAASFATGVAVGMAAEKSRPALKEAELAWEKLKGSDEFWK